MDWILTELLECNNKLHSSTYQTLIYTCMTQSYLLSTLFLEINYIFDFFICSIYLRFYCKKGRGRDRMVVGFTTICAISA
jgi:hypothetical protein